ncbi:MAG: hypothetical protein JO354_14815 [Verrucomicrobia bacterium]|nr:hypothetical protein [Verrucomicrobiota bacterium]
MCQTVLRLLIAAFILGALSAADTRTVAEAAKQIDAQLDAMKDIQGEAEITSAANALERDLDVLREKSIMLLGERKMRWDAVNVQLDLALHSWKEAASVEDRSKAFAALRKAWAALKLQYPSEALGVMPRLWSCPMHPELLETSPGNCPICGMSLEPVYETQPQLTSDPIIRAEIVAPEPLVVGKTAHLRIRLTFVADGTPVALADLEETHTKKIHLLIIEPTETDYHHEHPEPVGNGEYAFSFTPERPGTYRLWADLKPVKTHVQQFSIADIPASTHGGALQRDEPENRHAEINGYKFDLSFADAMVQEKATVPGKLRVTDPSGKPCDKLDVIMGSFGHFVGFGDDFSTVLHIHPLGAVPRDNQAHGGPELPFYFRSNSPGEVRLFTQVKIGGRDYFPRFVVKVQPLRHLAE